MKKMILGGTWLVGALFLGSISADAAQLYRAYNPNSGEHLYTSNANEIPFVVNAGWKSEGLAWEIPSSGAPVYRVYNPNAGDHHYTLNGNEKDWLVSLGWKYEGIAWQSAGSTPVYRAYNPNAQAGAHHFTTNWAEIEMIVRAGWNYEGIAFYSGTDDPIPTPAPQPTNPVDPDKPNKPEPKTKYTVFFIGDTSSEYDIVEGTRFFDSLEEARSFIDDYANNIPFGVGTKGYGVKEITVSQ